MISPQPLPSTSFAIHHWSIILPFDAVQSGFWQHVMCACCWLCRHRWGASWQFHGDQSTSIIWRNWWNRIWNWRLPGSYSGHCMSQMMTQWSGGSWPAFSQLARLPSWWISYRARGSGTSLISCIAAAWCSMPANLLVLLSDLACNVTDPILLQSAESV
jgi:hypothetical protein